VGPILLVGLGNPGDEYAATRHNVGFRVVDSVARALKARTVRSEGQYHLRTAEIEQRSVLLLKPLTYMNNSGTAVVEVIERYALPVERMLVAVDDFALPLGTLRLRTGGGDGGHNGLFSIALALQTTEYPRLRCGIGTSDMPPKKQMADFVLSPFSGSEEPTAERMISTAVGIALTFAREGLRAAVQQCSL
jgi:PTH1 family peptidyl-tRNA hydrolase